MQASPRIPQRGTVHSTGGRADGAHGVWPELKACRAHRVASVPTCMPADGAELCSRQCLQAQQRRVGHSHKSQAKHASALSAPSRKRPCFHRRHQESHVSKEREKYHAPGDPRPARHLGEKALQHGLRASRTVGSVRKLTGCTAAVSSTVISAPAQHSYKPLKAAYSSIVCAVSRVAYSDRCSCQAD